MSDLLEIRARAEAPDLYAAIVKKATEEYNLPMKSQKSIVGFGKLLDYYMFWISERRGVLFFNARLSCTRAKSDNMQRFPLVADHQEQILQAIDTICRHYASFQGREAYEQERQRVQKRATLREARKSHRDHPSATALLWMRTSVSAYQKAEETPITPATLDFNQFESLTLCAQQALEAFDNILNEIGMLSVAVERQVSIYKNYISSDRATLALLAQKYDLSRERIRQLINKLHSKGFSLFKRLMLLDRAEVNVHVETLASLLESIDYDLVHLLKYGMCGVGKRKKTAFVTFLFGNILEKTTLIELAQAEAAREEPIVKARTSFATLLPKVCYPSSLRCDQDTRILSFEASEPYAVASKVYEKLNAFEEIATIVKTPDLIYHQTSQTDHRPHLLLRLCDGTSVLVLVMPALNMAFCYNVDRCNALHRFCKKNGYGYLIIDDRFNSIYDLKNKALDPALVCALNEILEKKQKITREDVQIIKQQRKVSVSDIAAFVLQNKLYFTRDPFCIRYRK